LFKFRQQRQLDGTSPDPEACRVFTTYFCRSADPQRKTHAPADDIGYIAPWYDSMCERGLRGTVFHDGMSDGFINRYTTELIDFEYVDPAEFEYSVNDYRFFRYLDYIERRPELQAVFMTDGNDVRVVNDPFPNLRPDRIYVGSEMEVIDGNQWMQRRLWLLNQGGVDAGLKLSRLRRNWIYSAGILGGHRDICLQFLRQLVDVLARVDAEHRGLNLNMAAYNYLVYNHYRRRHVTGAPLHSRYKRYEDDRRDVWFIHK